MPVQYIQFGLQLYLYLHSFHGLQYKCCCCQRQNDSHCHIQRAFFNSSLTCLYQSYYHKMRTDNFLTLILLREKASEQVQIKHNQLWGKAYFKSHNMRFKLHKRFQMFKIIPLPTPSPSPQRDAYVSALPPTEKYLFAIM